MTRNSARGSTHGDAIVRLSRWAQGVDLRDLPSAPLARLVQSACDMPSAQPAVQRTYASPGTVWDWRQFGAMLLGEVAGKDVLALGCGAGAEALCLEQLGARVTVIDVLQMRFDPTSLPDDSFDRVHGIDILGRAGAVPALAEVRRLLRPGGAGVFLERIGRRTGEDQATLTWAELRAATLRFTSATLYPYHLMSRMHRFVPPSWRDTARRLDFGMLAAAPQLGRFAGAAVVRVIK